MSGLFTGYFTSREWFEPVPVEYLFHDKHHFADCVIEHEELHKLKQGMNFVAGTNKPVEVKGSASPIQSAVSFDEQQNLVKVKPSIN